MGNRDIVILSHSLNISYDLKRLGISWKKAGQLTDGYVGQRQVTEEDSCLEGCQFGRPDRSWQRRGISKRLNGYRSPC